MNNFEYTIKENKHKSNDRFLFKYKEHVVTSHGCLQKSIITISDDDVVMSRL